MLDRDGQIRADHACACVGCDPSLEVAGVRQGHHHVGVRFWGDHPAERREQRDTTVLLNEEAVHGVYEAILGDEGTVWAYRGAPNVDSGEFECRGYHQCLTCRDRAVAEGKLSAGGFKMIPGQDGRTQEVSINLCSVKLTGRVELRRDARERDLGE